MAKFIKNWVPVKMTSNKRIIVVFVQIDLTDKEYINTSPIDSLVNSGSVTNKIYLIEKIGNTGVEWFPIPIYLQKPWDELDPGHEILIRTYLNTVQNTDDDDSMNTGGAPTW